MIFSGKNVVTLLTTLARSVCFDCVVFAPAEAARPSRHAQPQALQLLIPFGQALVAEELQEEVVEIRDQPEVVVGKSAFSGDVSWQRTLALVWLSVLPSDGAFARRASSVAVAPNLRAAFHWINSDLAPSRVSASEPQGGNPSPSRVDVLVTGSVYLAGGALALLAPGGDGCAPGL